MRVNVPYWKYGSAGMVTALLRFFAVTGSEEYLDVLSRALRDVSRKYAIYPGRFFGLSGLGDCLLDVTDFSEEGTSAREAADMIADGLMLFATPRPSGIAFPGESLQRLSCDFGTGSAGVALFLHRLTSGCGPVVMLDQFLVKRHRHYIPAEWTKQQDFRPAPLLEPYPYSSRAVAAAH
jgi:hypothetical protein